MKNGYFMLQRRFFSHWLWADESRVFSKAEAFLDLLQLAAFTRTKRIVGSAVVQLEPGEVCGSERYLSGRWGWSTKKVRAFLTLLEADRMLGRQKKQGVTVITLCNYSKYTAQGSTEEAAKHQQGSTEEAPRKRIEEGEEGQKGEWQRPLGEEPEEKPLCTLGQALEVGSRNRLSPEAIRFWWNDRNSKGWRKGGLGSPRITSWQSDLANGQWAEEAASKASKAKATSNGRNGSAESAKL